MDQLADRIALVTGGGTGIGLAIARKFHAEGAAVAICGRRADAVSEAARSISAGGERVLAVPADICKEEDVRNLVARVVQWKGRLDILVNNAGAMRVNKAPEETTLGEWQSVIDTNITGTFLCSREAGRVMIRQKRGWIVNIGSMSGTVVNRYFHGGSYEVSKCAMHMLTKVLAVEWAQHGINVNAVAPGYYDTEPNREFFSRDKDLYKKVLELIPLHSLGDLDQLSRLVLTLVTDTTAYMTGTIIPINGGYTLYWEEHEMELRYKANAPATFDRLRQLLDRKASDRIFAAFFPPSTTMKSFQKKYSGFTEYPDPRERILFWESMFQERIRLEDDNIPAAYPSEFDQGLYGGLLGGDVRFLAVTDDGYVASGWISSMVPHLLKDLSDFATLKFSESHFWYKRFVTQLKIMAERGLNSFGIGHLIAIDSLNFVYELIGATDTYLAMYEVPDLVHKAIDFGFELNMKIHTTFFDIVKTLDGGTCSYVMPWMPGKIVNESVDPFHMTSVDDFEKWGREPAERLMARFEGGALHLHANGWHLLEAACTLKGMKAILLVDEKGHVPALQQIHELRRRAGDMPLSVYVSYKDFTESLARHDLAGGIFYYVSEAPDIDSANRLMEKVRSYRA